MSKLPKQWKHWCSAARLRPHTRGHNKRHGGSGWFYLRGRGRYWRLNDKMQFQCGDLYADFDRWALCDIREQQMPTSRSEFVSAVRELLIAHSAQEGPKG